MRAADYVSIQNLVYRYARCLDRGDYEGVGRLFAHADLYSQDRLVARSDARLVAGIWRASIRTYANGTPRTRHVVTNLIIEPDGDDRAHAESYVMVLQQTRALPLQAVVAGDYFDRFERVEGQWRFAERRIGIELFGNMGEHLPTPMPVPETDRRPQEW